jgi:hypothetical protein
MVEFKDSKIQKFNDSKNSEFYSANNFLNKNNYGKNLEMVWKKRQHYA